MTTSTCDVTVIPFGVRLRQPSMKPTNEDEDVGFGVVGSITLRGQSAVVWFGWGTLQRLNQDCKQDLKQDSHQDLKQDLKEELKQDLKEDCREDCNVNLVGEGRPSMGCLAVSMPSVPSRPVPTSQLLGGPSEGDMLLGQQISSRLAKRTGWPVFVSCSLCQGVESAMAAHISHLSNTPFPSSSVPLELLTGFLDGQEDLLSERAAAMAEKEVSTILLRQKHILAKKS